MPRIWLVSAIILVALGTTALNSSATVDQLRRTHVYRPADSRREVKKPSPGVPHHREITLYDVSMPLMNAPLSRVPVYVRGTVTFLPSQFLKERTEGAQPYLDDPIWVVAYYCSNLIPWNKSTSIPAWVGSQYRLTTPTGLSIVENKKEAGQRAVSVRMEVPAWGFYSITLVDPSVTQGAYIIQRIDFTWQGIS